MANGWMLAALLAGLWTGLSLPYVARLCHRHREDKVVKRAERNQEQLLNEWLYGDKSD